MQAKFYNTIPIDGHATNSQIFRLTNHHPINKYYWEKEKAVAQDKLARKYNVNKENIRVEEV